MDVHERWIPRVALAGAALHLALGPADPRTRELVEAGLVGALDGDPRREAVLWLLALGLAFTALPLVGPGDRSAPDSAGRVAGRDWRPDRGRRAGLGRLAGARARGMGDVGGPTNGRLERQKRGPDVQVSAIRPSVHRR